MKLRATIIAILTLVTTIALLLPTTGYSQRRPSAKELKELVTIDVKRTCMTIKNDAAEAEPWCRCISIAFGNDVSPALLRDLFVKEGSAFLKKIKIDDEMADRVTSTCGRSPANQDQNKYVRKGACVTLDGTEFKWHHANVPWKTLSCS
jgi:hypothetical protein